MQRGTCPWCGVWWTPKREGWAVGMKETEREQRRAGISEWVMCNVQGSAHYKMILVNYLEPAIYRMAGVDSRMGCLPLSLRHRVELPRPVFGWWIWGWPRCRGPCKGWHQALQDSPPWRFLTFSVIVAVALGPCVGRRQGKITPIIQSLTWQCTDRLKPSAYAEQAEGWTEPLLVHLSANTCALGRVQGG